MPIPSPLVSIDAWIVPIAAAHSHFRFDPLTGNGRCMPTLRTPENHNPLAS